MTRLCILVSLCRLNAWIIANVYILAITVNLLSNKIVLDGLDRSIGYLISAGCLLVYLDATQGYLRAILTTRVALTVVLRPRDLLFFQTLASLVLTETETVTMVVSQVRSGVNSRDCGCTR